MRVIAITKPCVEAEKELILSAVEKEDNVLFFDSEEALLKSENARKQMLYLANRTSVQSMQ